MTLLAYQIFQTVVEQGSFQRAAQVLNLTPSAISHAISTAEKELGFPLFHRNKNGITLTTVAVGSGANQRLLRTLAQTGKGRAYAADEFDNLPKIFTKETYLVSGSYVQNRTFTPVIVHDSILTDFPGFPRMTGYLATAEKNLATVELMSDREDPILAWWQYGAGRVLAKAGERITAEQQKADRDVPTSSTPTIPHIGVPGVSAGDEP